MARKFKKGIDYFSHDTNMRNDLKIKLLKAKFGLIGYAVFNLILEDIYSLGYYIKIDEDYLLLFASENGIEMELLNEIISFCTLKNLFDNKLYENEKILTSRRIQQNYLEATERRKSENKLMYDLCNINSLNDNINSINDNINSLNDNISTQRKEKKTKVNKIKLKERKEKKTYSEFLIKWNVFAELNKLSKIISLSESRESNLMERLTEPEFNFDSILQKVKESDFLLGKNDKGWKVSFDFIFECRNNYIKILEDKYKNNEQSKQKSSNDRNESGRNYTGTKTRRPGQSDQPIKIAGNVYRE